MDNWISYFVQVNLYLVLLGLSYEFGFKKAQNFKFGRPFLILGSLLAFILPFVQLPQAAQIEQTLQLRGIVLNAIEIGSSNANNFAFNWWLVAKAVLLIGFSVQFARMILASSQLYQLKKRSIPNSDFYEVPNSSCAFSFMNSIFIGANIPEEKKGIILKHELIHVKRRHSLDVLFAQLIQCILWYNPLSYKISSYLKEIHEFEADQVATENKVEYLELLLQQNFNTFNFSFVHQFNSNHLKNRIMRLKNNSRNPISPIAIFITLILFGLLFTSNQKVQAQVVEKSTKTTTEKVEVDVVPKYPGGNDALFNFIGKNISYPAKMKKRNIEATVYTELIIDKNGNVESHKFLKPTNVLFEEEVSKMIQKLDRFTPAQKDGKAVKSKITLPIKFKLNNKPPPPPPPPTKPAPPAAPTPPAAPSSPQ